MNNETHRKDVARKIRNIRKNLGLSMDDFARRIDDKAKSGTVSNWETGKNLPNNERLKRIAELGDISIDELLYGSLEEQLIKYITHYIENNESLELSRSSKTEVIDNAFKQAKNNYLISQTYGIPEYKHIFFSEIEDETNEAVLRLFNKTEFTNDGFIRFSILELKKLNKKLEDYRVNGIDEDLYLKTSIILTKAMADIEDLKY